jgi:type II secretory pathway pseudopilin PulG
MGASATLPASVIAVEPGHEATCTIVIANTGTVVDQLAVNVAGDVAEWTAVEPPVANLMPGESAAVTLRFMPPRSAELRPCSLPFAVHVASGEEPSGSVVEEGVVEILAFTELAVELVPATATGGAGAKYEVVVDNAGNHPLDVELQPVDREEALGFRLDRSQFSLDAGTAAFVPLRVRPRRRFLRGSPQRHVFQVHVAVVDGEVRIVEGVMVQRQLLPRWLLPALVALLVLAGALLALWLGVLRPAVKTAARAAANEQAVEVKASAQEARRDAGQARQEAATAKQNADRALVAQGINPNDANTAPVSPPPPAQPAPAWEPTDFRIAANAAIVTDDRSFREFAFTPSDPSKTLMITDALLQNPRGHIGTLRVLRDDNGTKSVLLEVGLGNYRDLDYHWVEPLRFLPGQRIVVAVSCQNRPEAGNCTPAVSFSGRLGS